MSGRSPTRIAIIGAGLIGGSIALRLVTETPTFTVAAYDQDAGTRTLLAKSGIEVHDTLRAAVAEADFVFVAVPPRATAASVVAGLKSNPAAVVADVASIKEPIVRAVTAEVSERELKRYVPTHPLAGAEVSGFDSASSGLLSRAIWAVCPASHRGSLDSLVRVGSILDLFDARLVACTSEQHDRAVAKTSHAPHLLAEIIAASLNGKGSALSAALSGGGFRDITRIAGADYSLWAQILEENWDEVRQILAEWGGELQRWAAADKPDQRGLKVLWQRGTGKRQLIEDIRWSEVVWRDSSCTPTWEALLELGRAGVAVRRARLDGDRLHFQRADHDHAATDAAA